MQNYTVSIGKADEFSGQRGEVSMILPDSGRHASVTIAGPRHIYKDQISDPETNWSALGGCSVADTKAYGHMLLFAATLAVTLEGPVRAVESAPASVGNEGEG